MADFEPDFNNYLKGTQGSKIESAKDLAAWNRAHAKLALPTGKRKRSITDHVLIPSPEYPNQEFTERSTSFDHTSDRRQKLIQHITAVGKSLPDTLDKYDIDIIVGPADSGFSKYSAATGMDAQLCHAL